MIKKILAIATILSISFAIDIFVPDNYGTIQDAVDAANDGDRIILARTNYNENVIVDNKDIIIGSEFLITGDELDILGTTIAGNSDNGSSIIFKNGISNEAGLIGLTVSQNLIFGGC